MDDTEQQPQRSLQPTRQSDALVQSGMPAGEAPLSPASHQGEEALRRSEDRYRALVQAIAQITWITAANGQVQDDLPSWRAYTGQSVEEIKDWGWLAAVHPADRERTKQVWRQAVETRAPYHLEYRLRGADGLYRSFLVRCVPVLEADGSLREWVGCCTGLRDRKRLETSLRETKRQAAECAGQLDATFAAMTDGVLIFDRQGNVLRLNRAAWKLLALDAMPAFAALPVSSRLKYLSIRDEQGHQFAEEHIAAYRIMHGFVVSAETEPTVLLRRLDGQERYVSVSGGPICDAKKRVVGGVVVLRDVTERHHLCQRTEQALKVVLTTAEALVQMSAEGESSLAAKNTTVLRLLQSIPPLLEGHYAAIFTQKPGEESFQLGALVGDAAAEEVHRQNDLQAALPKRSLEDVIIARVRAEEVLLLEPPSAALVDLVSGAPATLLAAMQLEQRFIGVLAVGMASDAAQDPHEALSLIRALSKLLALVIERDRLLAEREAARANALAFAEVSRRMDTFMEIVSHELKTPLAAIQLSVQLALRRLKHADEQEAIAPREYVGKLGDLTELLGRADQQSRRLARLVNDLLDVSRIRAEKLDLRLEWTDLVSLVQEAIAEQRHLTPERTIRLLAQPDYPTLVLADAERLRQVLANYLSNALKYSPEEVPVDVGLEESEHTVQVWVHDAGPGVAASEQGQIWERFYRAPGIAVQSGSGIGLGLGMYISKALIERHGGQVGLESLPGQGATFWFTLPRTAPGEQA